jgi:hypothetical protein
MTGKPHFVVYTKLRRFRLLRGQVRDFARSSRWRENRNGSDCCVAKFAILPAVRDGGKTATVRIVAWSSSRFCPQFAMAGKPQRFGLLRGQVRDFARSSRWLENRNGSDCCVVKFAILPAVRDG